MNCLWRICLASVFLLSVGCASYQTELSSYRTLLESGQPLKAAEKVKEKAFTDGKDQIVYLLEYATALQMAGDYKGSNAALQKADDLTDIKDYHSITKVSASMLGSATMVQYKGEDYEKVLINAMMAINFLMLKDMDNANAMTRRLNDKLHKYRYEAKKNYEQNPFAFYLSALVWEAVKDWDNAYINFKNVYDLDPSIPYLQEDLIRAAHRARREEDLVKWKKKWPKVVEANLKENGELILLFQEGWAPVKRPNPEFARIPKLYPVSNQTERARIEIDQGPTETSQKIFSVQDTAIKNLEDQYAAMIAGRAAGIAVKAVAADQLRQKNELLGQLAWIGMNIADQADLRQWMSLPGSFNVAKMRIRPGKYRARVVGLNSAGNATGESSDWQDVVIAPGKKTFITWRSVR